MRPRTTVLAAALPILCASPLRAQGFFVATHGGYLDMTGAQRSLDALVGSSGFATFGLETGYRLRRGLYASAGTAFYPTKTGERVFVAGPVSPVFRLGLPLTISRRAAYLNVGWRFLQKKRLMPYAAVGGELVSLNERSEVAGETMRQDQTKGGLRALVGVEWKAKGSLHVGVEAIGTTAPKAIGLAGVSKIYGDDDIGGIALVGKVIWSPWRKAPPRTS